MKGKIIKTCWMLSTIIFSAFVISNLFNVKLFNSILYEVQEVFAGQDDKVTICHIPPGNPDNAHTIKIDQSAVEAHVAHGDTMGACTSAGDDDDDDDDVEGCNVGKGDITLDASKSPLSGAGSVWSNNALYFGTSGITSGETVGLYGTVTSIINIASSGTLGETESEFETTEETYTGLKPAVAGSGKADPLSYFESGSSQLFDFGRYKKAAEEANTYYNSWESFKLEVDAGRQLYGIIYVSVDAATSSGGDDDDDDDAVTDFTLNDGSINIKGTLAFDITDPPEGFKITINVPVNINPANVDGSTTIASEKFYEWSYAAALRTNTASDFPWPSGYDEGWNGDTDSVATSGRDPRNPSIVDISSYGYNNFASNEDFPALMHTAGTVAIHNKANISGLVYSPDRVAIEQDQENSEVQFFSGAIVGGNGIYMESNSCGGGIAVIFDPDTLDFLNIATSSIGALDKGQIKRVD